MNSFKVLKTSIKNQSILTNGEVHVENSVNVQLPTDYANLFATAEEMHKVLKSLQDYADKYGQIDVMLDDLNVKSILKKAEGK